jgi:hypothetical protein
MNTKFWSENLCGRDQLEDLRLCGKINIDFGTFLPLLLREIGWERVDCISRA